MASAPSNHDYLLAVTAGPDYHDQKPVQVNSEKQLHIQSKLCTVDLLVRIQNYRGDDEAAQKSSPYFSDAAHMHDLYSLSFNFTPKEDINGHDLVFGNDFDHPVRDKLPPGFQQAFNIVKWFIDPGLYGDVHADEPYLYGPMLSSINTFRVGSKDDREHESVVEQRANGDVWIVHEGGDGEGKDARSSQGVPDDAAARKKYFLTEQHLQDFTFEKDREYSCDFFNPYLDFNGELFQILMPRLPFSDQYRLRSATARVQPDTWHHHTHHTKLGWPASSVSFVLTDEDMAILTELTEVNIVSGMC